jgi:hypothetical protein
MGENLLQDVEGRGGLLAQHPLRPPPPEQGGGTGIDVVPRPVVREREAELQADNVVRALLVQTPPLIYPHHIIGGADDKGEVTHGGGPVP